MISALGVMFYVVSEYQTRMGNRQKFDQLKFGADAVYSRVMVLIYNDQAWEATANFDTCMQVGVGCAPGAGGALILKDAKGEIYMDPTNVGFGLNREAKPCDSTADGQFEPVDGNNRCPYRYELSWSAVNCDAVKCDVEITGTFRYSPSRSIASMPFNAARYAIKTIRKKEDGSLQAACTSVGGVFDQVRLICTPKPESATLCPNGRVLRILVNGEAPVCEAIVNTLSVCPQGTAARGLAADGSLICEASSSAP